MRARARRGASYRAGGFAAPALKVFELSVAAPAVIAMRTSRMWAAGASPGVADRREFKRMSAEKCQAFGESLMAMAVQGQRAQVDWNLAVARAWWSMCMRSWWSGAAFPTSARHPSHAASRQLLSGMATMLDRGLAPLHKTATANARRLSRIARS